MREKDKIKSGAKMKSDASKLVPGTLTTDKHVAAALSCCRSTVWNLVKTGHLTPIRLTPKTTRFKTDQVLQLISQGVVQQ